MEEMTNVEKAERYDEAIKRAKELLEIGLKDTRDKRVVLSFFPELAESEDERIRRELIDFLEYYRLNNVLDSKTISLLTDSVAWLEKQGEQKPYWKPSDEQMEAIRIAYEVGTANDSWAMKVLKELYKELRKSYYD